MRSAVIVAMLRFTTWRVSTNVNKNDIQLCSYGAPHSQNRIDHGIEKAPFFGKKLSHVKLSAADDMARCDVLILGPETGRLVAAEMLVNKLSICDGCSTNKKSVVVVLELIEESIKFNINLHSAEKAGIKLSSELLILANKIIGKPDNV